MFDNLVNTNWCKLQELPLPVHHQLYIVLMHLEAMVFNLNSEFSSKKIAKLIADLNTFAAGY
jgi:hypothetical protein